MPTWAWVVIGLTIWTVLACLWFLHNIENIHRSVGNPFQQAAEHLFAAPVLVIAFFLGCWNAHVNRKRQEFARQIATHQHQRMLADALEQQRKSKI